MSDTQPGGQPAPEYNAQPAAPGYGAEPQKTPGKTLGIVGLILAILIPIVGLILSIVAVVQSRKAKASNIPGVIGIVIGVLGTIGWIIFWVAIFGAAGAGMEMVQQCLDGASQVTFGGETIDCDVLLNDPTLQQELQ